MKAFERFFEDDLLGVRFAINVFIGTTALWLLLRGIADKSPIWAIASMIAASEPIVKNAIRMFRGSNHQRVRRLRRRTVIPRRRTSQ